MSDRKRLVKAFEFVRENFFPRWDRARQWRVKIARKRKFQILAGYCNYNARTILIMHVHQDERYLYGNLIHEICHAVRKGQGGHNLLWRERMRKAVLRAQAMGQAKLAGYIQSQISYSPKGELTDVDGVYQEIERAVSLVPDWNFREVVRAVAKTYKISAAKLKRDYPLCREIYKRSQAIEEGVVWDEPTGDVAYPNIYRRENQGR